MYSPYLDAGQPTQWSEEPPILPTSVSILQRLLHRLLRILPLANLLECIIRYHALQALQFQCVTCRHQMSIVDDLDEWLDLRALRLPGFRHASRDLGWVALDASDECMWKRVCLGAGV